MAHRVAIHIDATGAYQGNGGFLMLSLLANEIAYMGYEVWVFDPKNRLTPEHFEWLDLAERHFSIRTIKQILDDDCPIITSWLREWLDMLETENIAHRIRIWDHDELLRTDSDRARQYVTDHNFPLYITNIHLLKYYRDVLPHVFAQTLAIPLWVRPIFCPGVRIPGRVGIQLDRTNQSVYARLIEVVGQKNILKCEGTQREVAEKMRTCDYFVHWNPDKNLVCGGEGFGLAWFEAAASGCVPLGRSHAGLKFLTDYHAIPLFDSWDQIVRVLTTNTDDVKEFTRQLCFETVQHNYRWNNRLHPYGIELMIAGNTH